MAIALGAVALIVPLILGGLGFVSERTVILGGARVHFDIYGRPRVVGETLPPERRPVIALALAVEEGRKMIVATVTQAGRPVERVKVEVSARSEAKRVSIGQDETLDDGTAAVPIPEKVHGDENGEIEVVATISAPDAFAGYATVAALKGATPGPHEMWTRACPESAAVMGAILLVGLCTAIIFRRLARVSA